MANLRTKSLAFLASLAALAVACGGGQGPNGPVATCKGQPRPQIDCASEVHYDGINTSGGVSVLSVGAQGKYEDTALRRINQEVEKYVAAQGRLCKDYNACVSDEDTYRSEAKALRERLTAVSDSAKQLSTASSDGDRERLLGQIYDKAVPAAARTEEIEFKMSVNADLPPELASQKLAASLVRPNEPLPSGAHVTLTFEVSKNSNLYIFQNSPESGLTVLFPDDRIGTANPLPANSPKRIPDGKQSFKLNDKDVGTEWIYVAVSTKSLDAMQAALKKVSAGQVTSIGQDPTLKAFASIDPGRSSCKTRALELDGGPNACSKTRGLILDDPEAPAARASLSVRTAPGDDTIVKAFPFAHVKPQDYAAAHAAFAAQTPAGKKTRGIIME